MTNVQPRCFFWGQRKNTNKDIQSWWQRGEAKTTVQPVSRDDSTSEESVQFVSSPSISLCSPPAVPHLIYDNQPNRVGSKLSCDKPLGRFIPSPNRTFFNKEAQQQFDELHSWQDISPTTLVCHDVPTR